MPFIDWVAKEHQQSLCPALQIGQIMLSIPNAYAKMGLAAGLCLSVGSGFISAYTIVLLVHLYEERKRRLVSHCMHWDGWQSLQFLLPLC